MRILDDGYLFSWRRGSGLCFYKKETSLDGVEFVKIIEELKSCSGDFLYCWYDGKRARISRDSPSR